MNHQPSPPWLSFAWHDFQIPKFGFTSWLILQERLLTKDRMSGFGMLVDLRCVLCMNQNESHSHLFCDCVFSRNILSACPVAVGNLWSNFCAGHFLLQHTDQIRTNICHLFISAGFHHIWAERNFRIHNPGQYNSSNCLIRMIKEEVRSKMSTCKSFQAMTLSDPSLISILY